MLFTVSFLSGLVLDTRIAQGCLEIPCAPEYYEVRKDYPINLLNNRWGKCKGSEIKQGIKADITKRTLIPKILESHELGL